MSGPSIDFRWVKQQVPPTLAFELLELTMKQTRPGQWRGDCPVCSSERTLVYTTDEGFTCHGACDAHGGDQIALAQFILDLPRPYEAFFEMARRADIPLKPTGTVRTTSKSTSTVRSTRTVPESERERAPSRPRGGGSRGSPPQPSRQERPFDPAAFAERLQFTDEVADLGLTEDQAHELGIGFYRGKLYQALRYPNGDVAGFSSFANGELKLPQTLLPMSSKVVQFPKRA